MSKVYPLKDYRPQEKGPREITFFACPFNGPADEHFSLSLTVTVENGDVLGVMEVVKNDGGCWFERDGFTGFCLGPAPLSECETF